MRILLDECVDQKFAAALPGHAVETVAGRLWRGLKNGELLRRAQEEGFEVFLTVDRNLAFQQNVSRYTLSVVVMCATSNRLRDLLRLADAVLKKLPEISPGQVSFVGGEDPRS